MDNITKRKVNEAIKRTLIYNSGKKNNRSGICLMQFFGCDSQVCMSNSNPEISPLEERETRECNISHTCYGCPFLKRTTSIFEQIILYKSILAFGYITSEDNESPFYSFGFDSKSFSVSEVRNFLCDFLLIVKESCYLTFNEKMLKEANYEINTMSSYQLYFALCNMENFCKENNIK